ncbi:glycerophosphodiester phosphodiesterase [Terrilactibacillus laevilacticus]|uniref:Glycerophosphodiester phosphodiesterase n=1 Tax=Terrilactibacillus laevilacticus TaxID=1380157 RepID=A0ABW5PQU9_9BACI|nr:glycerophosphodiester phosphodiesterase [Terrilactibacillus laevilacticus]
MKTAIFAHRGSKGNRPENTIAAFKEAMRINSDGIELDVHLTKDQELVIIHDEKIDRTTNGKGYVKDYTLQELKQFDAGAWFSDEYKGERIPTLKEVLTLLKDYEGTLNIELKTDRIDYPFIEQKVIDAVHEWRPNHPTLYSSFNHESLARLKAIEPEADFGILLFEKLYDPWLYARHIGASSLHLYKPAALSPSTSVIQDEGLAVRAWTINDADDMRRLFALDVDGIMTDYPERAMKIREEFSDIEVLKK